MGIVGPPNTHQKSLIQIGQTTSPSVDCRWLYNKKKKLPGMPFLSSNASTSSLFLEHAPVKEAADFSTGACIVQRPEA